MLARSLVALALLAFSGCGGDAAPALEGSLDYVRSGGLAGETEKLTIQPDGAATFSVDRGLRQETKDFKLESDELERIAKRASEADLASIEIPKAEPVPDAYAFSVAYDGNKVAWAEEGKPQELQELTDALSAVAEKYGRS